jgi:nicotinamide-nucleotide amidase
MKAEIITVGTEIMVGSILNTNARYLSKKLVEIGIEPLYHTSVDDNEERLKDVIKLALNRADIIITTGGLGPTQDDLTKEVIADALGLKLIKDAEVETALEDRFISLNRPMTDNNRKQAFKPEGSEFIKNENGTAPGIYIKTDNKKIVMLPGPPKELIPMFENTVIDLIKENYAIIIKSINTIGIGESNLEVKLKSLDIYEENFDIATYAKDGSVEIKIIARGTDSKEVEMKLKDKISKIEAKIGKYIYGYDNISIAEVLIETLKSKNKIMSICESCTGGKISSQITSIPGASKVFDRCIVTYSNNAKIEELSVNPDTLQEYGAVSKETAYEMAKGLLEKTKSDIAISITGIAGPDGGSEEKPVGLVFMCIMDRENHKVLDYIFTGDRAIIQDRAAIRSLFEAYKFLINM